MDEIRRRARTLASLDAPPEVSVGVVVLHFRHWPEVLHTVRDLHAQSLAAEVVIVDNGSEIMDFRSRIEAEFPDVKVLCLTHNLGYAGGMNAGVRELGDDVDVIVLVTHECRMEVDTIRVLVERLSSQPTTGAVGPLLVSKRTGTIDSAGGVLDHHLVPSHRSRHASTSLAPTGPEEVDWLDGATLVVRAEAWKAIGGLDESYFLYGEDVDLGIRLRRRGWGVELVPNAVVREESSGKRPGYWQTREQLRRIKLHGTNVQLIRLLAVYVHRVLRSCAGVARWSLVGDRERADNHRAAVITVVRAVIDGWRGGRPRRHSEAT